MVLSRRILKISDDHAEFLDPIIHLNNKKRIRDVFQFTFFNLFPERRLLRHVMLKNEDEWVVAMDAEIEYVFFLWPHPCFVVRQTSRWEFNDEGKVMLHEDVWSLRDTLEHLPVPGLCTAYRISSVVLGRCSAALMQS
jgi:hypothetical protein